MHGALGVGGTRAGVQMKRVDQIAIAGETGRDLVSIAQWERLSVAERVDFIRASRVEFLCGEDVVPLREALEWIKQNKGAVARVE